MSKYYGILYKGVEHLHILVLMGDCGILWILRDNYILVETMIHL
jgi:hypothetical protein